MQSEITKLNKSLKKYLFLDEIDDIILFGSLLKGKDKPNDIDLLIIFKEKINKNLEFELRKKLKDPYQINSITKKELDGDNFIAKEGLYLEGYSFFKKDYLSNSLGFISLGYLKYDLKNIKGSKRIRFYYALMGRNKSKGFLSELNAKRFSDSVIVCDYSQIEKLKEFFDNWEIDYIIVPSLVPKRLKKILLV